MKMSVLKEKTNKIDAFKNDLVGLLSKHKGITKNDMLDIISTLDFEECKEQKTNSINKTNNTQYCDMIFWQ